MIYNHRKWRHNPLPRKLWINQSFLKSFPDAEEGFMQYPGKQSIHLMLALCLLLLSVSALQADPDREEKQAELDAACEAAREQKLAPMREQMVKQCVHNKEQPDRAACEAYYSDYGARAGSRAPLFYDLPECVKAFDYQASERQS
jgi:hypothetical protein